MTNEQAFFLTVLKDHILRQGTRTPDGLDWAWIARCAKSHQVEGIVWHQCQGYLKANQDLTAICEKLRKASLAEAYYYVNNQMAYEEVAREFRVRGIRFVSVKGLQVAKLYPVPAYRTMGDMDLLVAAYDFEKVREIMPKLGYQRKTGETVLCYGKNSVNFEIHQLLVNSRNNETAQRKAFFNHFWDHVSEEDENCVLDRNFHFIFLIEHTKQHFSASGVGFRQFLDIAVVAMSDPELDWDLIRHDLKKIGLWDFAVTAFAFCKKWWGFDLPFETPEPDETFYAQSTEFVFQNGVFGFDNENAKVHFLEKQMRVSRAPRAFRSLAIAVRKVCISYDAALTLPYCAFVRNRKYLLPAVWIYRIFYVAFHKKGNIASEVDLVFRSGDAINVHRALMDRWGV